MNVSKNISIWNNLLPKIAESPKKNLKEEFKN